jgi:hypothetical protein
LKLNPSWWLHILHLLILTRIIGILWYFFVFVFKIRHLKKIQYIKYFETDCNLIQLLFTDWDNDDRPRNWREMRNKWADCPRQFRMLEAPYCYRYWRYFANLDPWFGRSITDNSRNDWYGGGWGIRDTGRVPIRRMRRRKD